MGAKFKKSAKGSRVLDNTKVAIDRIMLVCQHPNGIDVAYSDPDGFGHPGTMGPWDLHSSDALSWARLQLKMASWMQTSALCVPSGPLTMKL